MDHWFHGPQKSERMQSDAEALGLILPDDDQPPVDYGVWPENWPAVELFLRCSTQWRTGEPSPIAPAGVCGLDYSVVLALATLYLPASAETQTILEDVQIMERRALELIYERAKADRERD